MAKDVLSAGTGGGYAGAVNIADKLTFERTSLHRKRCELFDQYGVTGTFWESASDFGAVAAREAGFAALTLGNAQAIRGGAQGASWGTRIINQAAQSRTYSRVGRGIEAALVVRQGWAGSSNIVEGYLECRRGATGKGVLRIAGGLGQLWTANQGANSIAALPPHEQILYRGVGSGSRLFGDALQGRATPPRWNLGFGGPTADVWAHNRDYNDTAYTSWTMDPRVAHYFATEKSESGVVLKIVVPSSRVNWSPDLGFADTTFGRLPEQERLLNYPVRGAEVIHVTR